AQASATKAPIEWPATTAGAALSFSMTVATSSACRRMPNGPGAPVLAPRPRRSTAASPISPSSRRATAAQLQALAVIPWTATTSGAPGAPSQRTTPSSASPTSMWICSGVAGGIRDLLGLSGGGGVDALRHERALGVAAPRVDVGAHGVDLAVV